MANLQEFLKHVQLTDPDGVLPLNADQLKALQHEYAQPLWIVAGPGTGKTHTLAWLMLKRVLVDGVPPERIVFTTFTRKAAAELESRLIVNRQKLIDSGFAEAADVELTQALVGTLHGLCSRILQDKRYEPTLRIRVLEDELTQDFFIRRSRNPLLACDDLAFWKYFKIIKEEKFPPNEAGRASGASKLFNRMTENSVDLDAMESSANAHLQVLANAYRAYQEALVKSHRSDQAHLQKHFLDFLATPEGRTWLGDGLTVLVDEYQDTNAIQEEIYFALANRRGDLTVVGDDDQSLYRFRGATVESLIDFDRACQIYLGRNPLPVYLSENRRSHPRIVEFVNNYIGGHPEMTDPVVRVRAPGKPALSAKSSIKGPYPAVTVIGEKTHKLAGQKAAQLVRDILDDGLVEDPSQIAFLTFSTRETSHGIKAYTEALRAQEIPYCNPRNRTAHKDERFLALLGGLCQILDPDFDEGALPAGLPRGVPEYVTSARDAFQEITDSGEFPGLNEYVVTSQQAIAKAKLKADREVTYLVRKGGRRVTLAGLLFKLLGQEPFSSDLTDAEASGRLRALNLVLAEYESLYDDGQLRLKEDGIGRTRIDPWTLYNFYSVFVEGIHDGLNDPEDEEVSIQEGMVNVMTIHQSKGLEFEVAFVLRPDKQPWVSDTHELEDKVDPYVRRKTKPPVRRTQEQRAAEDTIRLFFVAYSRAKRLLVITGQFDGKKWNRVLGRAEGSTAFTAAGELQALGVHAL